MLSVVVVCSSGRLRVSQISLYPPPFHKVSVNRVDWLHLEHMQHGGSNTTAYMSQRCVAYQQGTTRVLEANSFLAASWQAGSRGQVRLRYDRT